MADKPTSALQPDSDAVIPRISLGEQGIIGLRTSGGRILEEPQAAFRYPAFLNTVAEMRNNPTVGAAINVYRLMMSRVNWCVEPPEDADEKDIARAEAVETMMHDMDGQTWNSFIESVLPYLEYGFAINEIVLRRRLKRNGSKYNDGLVGIKKLAPRSQDTIAKWIFSEDGAELLGVEQHLRGIDTAIRYAKKTDENGLIKIDREKFLLFSASANKGNPEGNSIYKNIYLAFKQLTLLQEQEMLGIAKDVQGILKIEIPPQYLSPDASPDQKLVFEQFRQIIDNYNAGRQRGLLVPNMVDIESKLPLFKYELLESKGSAKYDTEAVIKRLQGDILSALNVDVLKLGSEGSGSFSLAESKSSILALAIDYRLKEIQSVLNNHLMRTIYEMNGWSCEKMARFEYEDVEAVDIETLSKAVQRIYSTSAVEVDREVMNVIRTKIFGVAGLPDDEPVDKEKLPAAMTGQTTSAGKGMEVGTTGNGTSKGGGSGQNTSDNNANNKS